MFCPLTHGWHNHPKHMVSSAKTAQMIKQRREGCCWRNWAQEHLFALHNEHGSNPPCLPSLLWYSPDRSQWLLNVEDELQRQLVQRQLARSRRQAQQRGKMRGSSCRTCSLDVWQGHKGWGFDSVSELIWRHVFVEACLSFTWSVWSVSFLFLFYPSCLPSCSIQQSASGAICRLACSISLPGQCLFPPLFVCPPLTLLAAG